jgi:hypothetical protein
MKYHERKAAGVCVDCKGIPVPGMVRCAACAERRAEGLKKRFDAFRDKGQCRCGAPMEVGVSCNRCRNRRKAREDAHEAAGRRRDGGCRTSRK